MPRTHKTLPRLYVEPDLASGQLIALGREQANYLVNVLRMGQGDELVVFNGRDGAWLGKIESAVKKSLTIKLLEQSAPQTPPSGLWYGFAPLKAARLDYIVQKAVEMGVGIIQPVITQHTQVSRIKTERLHANAIEAAEQCEVLFVPEIAPEITLPKLIAGWKTGHGDRKLILADESEVSASPAETLNKIKGERVGLLIGPEGGFSDEERDLLRRQDFVVPVSLGPRILRADTAAVAALAVIQSIIGDWR